MSRITFGRLFTAVVFSAAFASQALAGSLSGTVKFEGEAPNFKEIKMDADPICVTHHKEPAFPQTLLLGSGNTMGNVFVFVKNPPAGDYKAPADPVVVDQKGCTYSPHVFGVMVNQPVKILNPDGTLHNVHALSKVNPEFNVAMPKFRTEITKTFNKPEGMFALKCDVHPWMAAWMTVMSHPFYSVSNAEGKYEIKDLPDGTYTLVAWHEKLGSKEATVTVAGGAQVSDFSFAAPTKS